MAQMIPHRSENDIKNKWNSMMRKEMRSRGNKVSSSVATIASKKTVSAAANNRSAHVKASGASKICGKKVTFAKSVKLPALEEDVPFLGEDLALPESV